MLQPRDLRILPSIFALAEIALLGLSCPGHSESHVWGLTRACSKAKLVASTPTTDKELGGLLQLDNAMLHSPSSPTLLLNQKRNRLKLEQKRVEKNMESHFFVSFVFEKCSLEGSLLSCQSVLSLS